jgi:hypothetical protein
VEMARAFLTNDDGPNFKSLPHLPAERFFQTDQTSKGVSVSLFLLSVFLKRTSADFLSGSINDNTTCCSMGQCCHPKSRLSVRLGHLT